jgi:hypothetical protein
MNLGTLKQSKSHSHATTYLLGYYTYLTDTTCLYGIILCYRFAFAVGVSFNLMKIDEPNVISVLCKDFGVSLLLLCY